MFITFFSLANAKNLCFIDKSATSACSGDDIVYLTPKNVSIWQNFVLTEKEIVFQFADSCNIPISMHTTIKKEKFTIFSDNKKVSIKTESSNNMVIAFSTIIINTTLSFDSDNTVFNSLILENSKFIFDNNETKPMKINATSIISDSKSLETINKIISQNNTFDFSNGISEIECELTYPANAESSTLIKNLESSSIVFHKSSIIIESKKSSKIASFKSQFSNAKTSVSNAKQGDEFDISVVDMNTNLFQNFNFISNGAKLNFPSYIEGFETLSNPTIDITNGATITQNSKYIPFVLSGKPNNQTTYTLSSETTEVQSISFSSTININGEQTVKVNSVNTDSEGDKFIVVNGKGTLQITNEQQLFKEGESYSFKGDATIELSGQTITGNTTIEGESLLMSGKWVFVASKANEFPSIKAKSIQFGSDFELFIKVDDGSYLTEAKDFQVTLIEGASTNVSAFYFVVREKEDGSVITQKSMFNLNKMLLQVNQKNSTIELTGKETQQKYTTFCIAYNESECPLTSCIMNPEENSSAALENLAEDSPVIDFIVVDASKAGQPIFIDLEAVNEENLAVSVHFKVDAELNFKSDSFTQNKVNSLSLSGVSSCLVDIDDVSPIFIKNLDIDSVTLGRNFEKSLGHLESLVLTLTEVNKTINTYSSEETTLRIESDSSIVFTEEGWNISLEDETNYVIGSNTTLDIVIIEEIQIAIDNKADNPKPLSFTHKASGVNYVVNGKWNGVTLPVKNFNFSTIAIQGDECPLSISYLNTPSNNAIISLVPNKDLFNINGAIEGPGKTTFQSLSQSITTASVKNYSTQQEDSISPLSQQFSVVDIKDYYVAKETHHVIPSHVSLGTLHVGEMSQIKSNTNVPNTINVSFTLEKIPFVDFTKQPDSKSKFVVNMHYVGKGDELLWKQYEDFKTHPIDVVCAQNIVCKNWTYEFTSDCPDFDGSSSLFYLTCHKREADQKTCMSLISRGDKPFPTQWYTPPATPVPVKKLSGGAIAGIAVGSACGVTIVVVVVVLIVRKRSKQQAMARLLDSARLV